MSRRQRDHYFLYNFVRKVQAVIDAVIGLAALLIAVTTLLSLQRAVSAKNDIEMYLWLFAAELVPSIGIFLCYELSQTNTRLETEWRTHQRLDWSTKHRTHTTK